jgi:preprotein translocase subunit YajC
VAGLLLPLLLLAAMWFLLILPQQRKMKAQKSMQSSLKAGDDILMTSGIYGTVTELEDGDTMLVEISQDVEVRIARGAVLKIVASAPAAAPDPDPDLPEGPVSEA